MLLNLWLFFMQREQSISNQQSDHRSNSCKSYNK